ncbi:MAG: hypothetical protein ABI162_09705 [Luteolibacter sp.]
MMNSRKYLILSSIVALGLSGIALLPERASAAQDAGSEDVEVLTRGPVHEAFAGTISYDPVQGILVNAKPPEPIEEVPPEQQLEGENVVWIPGYWAWDEDQNDFLWVSGIWRNLPPGRQWVPGYWSEVGGQYQWTSGYWADTENTEVTYLPEPPRSVETGPNIEAPSDNYSWVPGNWMWRESRYAWRSGYWAECRPNWNWEPSCYRWTRRGYVYVDGYWDYAVARRGVLFAPVYFGHDVYSRPGFCYSPTTVISVSVFTNHLFLRPRYGHYYFGDYYAPRYHDSGYYASFSYNSGRRGCDPIYAYQAWENRGDRNWQQSRRNDYHFRRDHEEARPPHTWAVLGTRPEADRARGRNFDLAQPLDRMVANRGERGQRFKAVDQPTRERFVAQRQEVRKFEQERQRLETRGERPQNAASAVRTKSTRSPIAARASANESRGDAPPKRLERRPSEQAQQTKGKSAEKPGAAFRPDSSIRPQADRRAEQSSAGKFAPQSNRQSVPQPNRKMQPEPKHQAVSPPREAKPQPPAVIPRPARQAETAPSRQVQPRQALPQPSRKIQPEAKRQAVSPAPYKSRPEAARQVVPQRQIRPEAPAVRRQQAAPQQRAIEPRRAAPAPQHVQPQRRQAPQFQQQPPSRRAAPAQQAQRAQPQRQQAQRVQPAPQRPQARPAAPQQNQARPAPGSDAQKKKEEARRNKIRQTI